MIQLLLVSLLAVVGAGTFYIVGKILVQVLRLAIPFNLYGLFLRLIFGLSAVVIGYALVRTRFNTVLTGLVFTLGGVAWGLRPTAVEQDLRGNSVASPTAVSNLTPTTNLLPLLLLIAVLMTAMRFPLLYNFSSGYYDAPFLDIVYYAKLVFPLNQQGVETSMLEPTTLIQPVPQPYHYFEIWLSALLTWITPLAPAVSLFILAYSLILTVVYIGYCALFEHFGQPRYRALLLGLSCLFIAGIFLPIFNQNSILLNSMFSLLPYLVVFPKLAPVYIFMILGFLLYIQEKKETALWAWVSIPLVYVSTAPAVLVTLGLLAIGLAIRGKASLLGWIRLLLPLIVVTLFLGGFYFINSKLNPQSADSILIGGGVKSMLVGAGEWRTSLNIVIGAALAFGAYYFWYAALLIAFALPNYHRAWHAVRSYSGLLFLVGGLFVTGLLLWGLGYHLLDAWQFFNNALVPAMAVLIATLAAILLSKLKAMWAYLFTVLIAFLIVINLWSADWKMPMHATVSYSPSFLTSVSRVAPMLSLVGAYVLGPDDYNGPYAYNAYTRTPAQYLSTLQENTPLVNISHITLNSAQIAQTAPAYSTQISTMIERTPIRLFARQRRALKPELTDAQLQREFILREHINFVAVAPSAKLPASLRSLVQRVLHDPVTQEKLYILQVK